MASADKQQFDYFDEGFFQRFLDEDPGFSNEIYQAMQDIRAGKEKRAEVYNEKRDITVYLRKSSSENSFQGVTAVVNDRGQISSLSPQSLKSVAAQERMLDKKASKLFEQENSDDESKEIIRLTIDAIKKTGKPQSFEYSDKKGTKHTVTIEPAGDPKADKFPDGMPEVNVFDSTATSGRRQISRNTLQKMLDDSPDLKTSLLAFVSAVRAGVNKAIDVEHKITTIQNAFNKYFGDPNIGR